MPYWPRRPGPELRRAIKIKPTGVEIWLPGHQNGDRGRLNVALGAREYVPKVTLRGIKSPRPRSRSFQSISKHLHRSYVEPSNYAPTGCWSWTKHRRFSSRDGSSASHINIYMYIYIYICIYVYNIMYILIGGPTLFPSPTLFPGPT